jgi:hypothetical protein
MRPAAGWVCRMDLFFILVAAVFFLLCGRLVKACDRL